MRGFSAIACFANAAVLGYALHRLGFAATEPDPRTLGPSVHVGYFWRVATALWWGSLAALGGWRLPALGDPAARALPVAVIIATVIAFTVP